jgi:hypothetical protein
MQSILRHKFFVVEDLMKYFFLLSLLFNNFFILATLGCGIEQRYTKIGTASQSPLEK